jgi:kumamolisin
MAVPKGFKRLAGSYVAAVEGFVRSEAVAPNHQIKVTVRVRRRPGAPPLPKGRGKDRLNLLPEEFDAKWGASPDDIAAVKKYARDSGLEVLDISDGVEDISEGVEVVDKWAATEEALRAVKLRGTAKSLQAAFAVSLNRYEPKLGAGDHYIGREGWIHVPVALQGIVTGVFGLDMRPIGVLDFPIEFRSDRGLPTPLDVASRYEFPGDNDDAENATGQTIALLEFGGGFNQPDINDYFAEIGQPAPVIKLVGINGGTNNPGPNPKWDGEVTMNICIAGSVARGATLVVYFAPLDERGWTDAVRTCVRSTTYKPTVISISWGAAELHSAETLTWSADGIDDIKATFEEAAALHITVLASSGNRGSSGNFPDRRAHVAYPASDPKVIACGGSSIADFGAPPYTERPVAWSGGGISRLFETPDYQKNNVPLPASVNTGQVKLGVPDVCGYASPGYKFIYDGDSFEPTGTSLVAPLYAALMARINTFIGAPQGFIHDVLYQAAGTTVFRDMAGGPSNSYGPPFWSPGYNCTIGWDAVTGLGVIDGQQLLAKLQN